MISPRAAKAFVERAKSGKICFGVHHSAISPQLIEMYGYLGLDYVIIGTEVESVDRGVMENLMRAADASGIAPIVKMLRNDGLLIEEAMNYGAPLVTVPHIYTRAHLDAAVRHSRFQPRGTRGICPVARYNAYGIRNLDETHAMADQSRSVIAIIEDVEALDHLDEMMSSSDIDIFEVGPFDLSQSLGVRRELTYGNKETMAAIEKIAAAAKRHKKGVLVPLWLTDDADSPAKLVRKQMDELLSRGITIFYMIEMVMMGRLLRDLMKLRDAI
jgi:4-hydroxy-2-oxoheptanedioate aldolase